MKFQFDNLHCQHIQLELDHHLLLDERDILSHKLDECQRKYISIEDEYRSLQETVYIYILMLSRIWNFFFRNFKMKKN